MKLNLKLTFLLIGLTFLLKAQIITTSASVSNPTINKRGCGTKVPPAEWDNWFNQKVKERKLNLATGKTQQQSITITIPVVVHVIHGGQAVGTFPNISQAQINSQIAVMNKDFAGNGFNTGLLATTGFSTVGTANTNITFCLAQLDPIGNTLTEPGIDRVNYTGNSWTNPATPSTQASFQGLMDNVIKPGTIWDPTYYFNIWVSDVNQGASLLGYATFPAATSLVGLPSVGNGSTDGIWVWAMCFGNVGTLQPPYTKGRTATHEAGHWVGLRHIGGDGNGNVAGDCSATDYCDDTPPQKGGFGMGQYGQNFGAPGYPLHANTCAPDDPFGDMFMNFMDYTDDPYCYLFTPDQDLRIQTAMSEGVYRNQLNASSATLCVGLPDAGFIVAAEACIGEDITLSNLTTGSPAPSYSWSVKPAQGVTISPNTTTANPTFNFNATGSYTVRVVASNNIGVTAYTSAIEIADCVGINNQSLFDRNVSIAPNPSSGMVNIKVLLKENQNLQVTVYNALSELISSQNYPYNSSNNFSLNLSGFPQGIYTVTINNGAEKVVRRVILNK